MKKIITSIAVIAMLSACATRGAGFSPMVDTKGKDSGDIATNTAECQYYAEKQAGAGSGAIAGAIFGALLMAALAPGGSRNNWATQGAIVGGTGGAVGANESQEAVIRKCLQGRGFSVLN